MAQRTRTYGFGKNPGTVRRLRGGFVPYAQEGGVYEDPDSPEPPEDKGVLGQAWEEIKGFIDWLDLEETSKATSPKNIAGLGGLGIGPEGSPEYRERQPDSAKEYWDALLAGEIDINWGWRGLIMREPLISTKTRTFQTDPFGGEQPLVQSNRDAQQEVAAAVAGIGSDWSKDLSVDEMQRILQASTLIYKNALATDEESAKAQFPDMFRRLIDEYNALGGKDSKEDASGDPSALLKAVDTVHVLYGLERDAALREEARKAGGTQFINEALKQQFQEETRVSFVGSGTIQDGPGKGVTYYLGKDWDTGDVHRYLQQSGEQGEFWVQDELIRAGADRLDREQVSEDRRYVADKQYNQSLMSDSARIGIANLDRLESAIQAQNRLGFDRDQLHQDADQFDRQLTETQRQFVNNFAETQRQFDTTAMQTGFQLEEEARQSDAAIASNLNQARQQTSQRIQEILRNPSDYLARAYTQRGEQPPFAPVDQAGLINEALGEYNQYAAYLDSLGRGFESQRTRDLITSDFPRGEPTLVDPAAVAGYIDDEPIVVDTPPPAGWVPDPDYIKGHIRNYYQNVPPGPTEPPGPTLTLEQQAAQARDLQLFGEGGPVGTSGSFGGGREYREGMERWARRGEASRLASRPQGFYGGQATGPQGWRFRPDHPIGPFVMAREDKPPTKYTWDRSGYDAGFRDPDDLYGVQEPRSEGQFLPAARSGQLPLSLYELGAQKEEQGTPYEDELLYNEKGGATGFGNPVIVGDSGDGRENQELVMSFGGAPVVVLPMTDRQEDIMEEASGRAPRAQLGGLYGNRAPYSMLADVPSQVRFGDHTFGFGGNQVTQAQLRSGAEQYSSPAVRGLFAGQRAAPLRYGFSLFTPGQMSRLTAGERAELGTRLASRNVALADVEQAVMRQFGPTGARRGRRRF